MKRITITVTVMALLMAACRSEAPPPTALAAEAVGALRPLVFEGPESLDEGIRRAVLAWAEQVSTDGIRLGLEGVNTQPGGPVVVTLRERRGEGRGCRDSLLWLGFSHTADEARMTAIPTRRFGDACCPGQPCTPNLGGHHLATVDVIRRGAWEEFVERIPDRGPLALERHGEDTTPTKDFVGRDRLIEESSVPRTGLDGCDDRTAILDCVDETTSRGAFTCTCATTRNGRPFSETFYRYRLQQDPSLPAILEFASVRYLR